MWQCHPRGAWREVHGRGHSHVCSWSNTRRPRGLLVCAFSASSLPRPSIPTPLTLSPNGPASYFRGTGTVRRLSRDCRSAPGPLLLPAPASEMPSLAWGHQIPPPALKDMPQAPHPLSVPHPRIAPPCWIILIQIQTHRRHFCLYEAGDCTSCSPFLCSL